MTELSRRTFIQLSVIGGAVAATGLSAGCRNERVYKAEVTGQYGGYDNRVYPYLNQPDGLQDGVPQYFATTCQMCPAGCGLFVRTIGGRAHKIEGNPDHPVNAGKTCARGQAALQHLYHPDRLRFPALARRGKTIWAERDPNGDVVTPPRWRRADSSRTDWETALARTAAALGRAGGRAAILVDAVTIARSPSLMDLVTQFARTTGASVTVFGLLDDAPWRAAAKAVYGQDQVPAYRLDEADFLLSFSGDFLEAWPSPVLYSRLFGEFRQGPRRRQGEHGRFIAIGPRMSMTAAKADQWLPCRPGSEAAVALGLLSVLGGPGIPLPEAASQSGIGVSQLQALGQSLGRAGSRALAIGGTGLLSGTGATAALTAVEALNVQAGSRCVAFGRAAPVGVPVPAASHGRQITRLIGDMQTGQVDALVILGQPNPAFALPDAAGWPHAIARVPFVAALTPFEDDTTLAADILLPTRTFLEEWGDDLPGVLPAGVTLASLRQPIIDPQFVGGHGQAQGILPPAPWMDTRATGDLLLDMARRLGRPLADAGQRDTLRRLWAGLGQSDPRAASPSDDPAWVAALSRGGVWSEPARDTAPAGQVPSGLAAAGLPAAPGTFQLHLYPHLYWTDGRQANLGWMQEIPDPMTSAVWNTWVELNLDVAHEMGIRTGDIVRLTGPQGLFLEAPAVPFPAIHPEVVAMPIGQGQALYGRNTFGRGANPLAILDPVADEATGALAYGATRVRLTKVRSARPGYNGDQETLVLAQDRPGGTEPEAVQDLIHTTARDWKKAKPVKGAPQAAGSIFHRNGEKPAEH